MTKFILQIFKEINKGGDTKWSQNSPKTHLDFNDELVSVPIESGMSMTISILTNIKLLQTLHWRLLVAPPGNQLTQIVR